ncbi:MAG: MFS transporter [Chlamydiales bacterium]|nr:MFS transporter [Chlamydiales bacterium]
MTTNSKPALKTTLLILCFGAFLNWMSYGLIYPIFSVSIFDPKAIFLGETSEALKGFWLGVLLAASPLAQFFSSPVIGELSDRKGRKPILQMTTFLIALGALVSALGIWKKSLLYLLLGRIITGFGSGNIAAINSSIADFSSPLTKTKNFALIAMANGIGFAIGPFLGGKLSTFGFEIPFIFATCLTTANFIFIRCFFSETLSHNKKNKTQLVFQLRHFWKITYARPFRVIFLAFFAFCFGWSYYWEFIPVTWIKIYGIDANKIGNFYAFGSLIYIISSGILIRFIVNKFKAFSLLFTSLIILGFILLILIHARIEWYWINIAMQQFLIALIFPVGTAIVSNLTPPNKQGETQGVFQSLQSFAFAATPFIGGGLLPLSYNSPLFIGSSLIFIAGFILLAGKRR